MTNLEQSVIALNRPTLPLSGLRAYGFQIALIGTAVILPLVAHLSGAPVRNLLPMHWPVILAGLVYGWRGGAVTGLLAPIVSWLISGFPLPGILPSMTVELLAYGFITGFLCERTTLKTWVSVTIALVAGRGVFVGSVLFGHVVSGTQPGYFLAALLPGLTACIGQVALLPLLARWWVGQERAGEEQQGQTT